MIYVFGQHVLDTQLYELRARGVAIPLGPKVFSVLVYLVSQRHRVVSKQELLTHVWSDLFVSEAAVVRCVTAARHALGDDGETQEIIKTVYGRGYRFVAVVEEHADVAEASRPSPPPLVATPEAAVAPAEAFAPAPESLTMAPAASSSESLVNEDSSRTVQQKQILQVQELELRKPAVRIILVDDEKLALSQMCAELQEQGWEVDIFNDPREALVALQKSTYDLGVFDISMPGMSGVELFEQAKTLQNTMDGIFITAYPDVSSAIEAVQLGALDYLQRPFELSELVQAINRALTHHFTRLKNADLVKELEDLRSLLNKSNISNRTPGFSASEVTIIRSIEFPPAYHLAGIGILNYFGNIVHQKYPEEHVTVKIEQEGLTVRMIIETPEGIREQVEQALTAYGLVVTGQMSPEKFTSDPHEVIELRNELRIARVRIESQRELLQLQTGRVESLEVQVKQLHSILGVALQATDIKNIPVNIQVHTVNEQAGGNMDSRKYTARRSAGVVQGDHNSDNAIDARLHITESLNGRVRQIENIDKLLEALKTNNHLEPKRKDEAARSLTNVKEEMSEQSEPDKSKLTRWLERSKQALQGLKLGKELTEQAKDVFDSFNLPF